MNNRLYQRMEHFLVMRMPRQRVTGIWRLIFRLPILAYRLGFGWMLGSSILLLETAGRVSGKKRYTAIGYGYDAETDTYYIHSGWGRRTDWFRNLARMERCQMRVGSRRYTCAWRVVPPEESIAMTRLHFHSNPYAAEMWAYLLGRKLDVNSEADMQLLAAEYPMVALEPLNSAPAPAGGWGCGRSSLSGHPR